MAKDFQHQWTIHPFRRQKARGLTALVIIAVFSTAIYKLAGLWLLLFCDMVLLYSLTPFYFATAFAVDKKELAISRPLRRKQTITLKEIRSYYSKKQKVYLFREKEPLVLTTSRAICLEFSEQDKKLQERVVKLLNKKGCNILSKAS